MSDHREAQGDHQKQSSKAGEVEPFAARQRRLDAEPDNENGGEPTKQVCGCKLVAD
jgi:hypothetical protein